MKCFAGCETVSVLAAVGLTMADLYPPRDNRPSSPPTPKPLRSAAARTDQKPRDDRHNGQRPPGAAGAPAAVPKQPMKPDGDGFATADAAIAALARKFGRPPDHRGNYHDASSQLIGAVVRWYKPDGKKEVRPVGLIDGRWHSAAVPGRPLQRLPELLQHEPASGPILLVEGETKTDAAELLGLLATTWPGGCKTIDRADLTPLAGRDVALLPDNDDGGRKAMETAAETLQRLNPPATVRVVELPGLPEKGDLVDWIAAHGDTADPETLRAELLDLIDATEPEPLPEPEPRPEVLTWQPFPVEELPVTLREFVDTVADSCNCDPAYAALPALAVVASVIGTTHRLRIKRGWDVPCGLWCVVVGESGSGKSPAMAHATQPLRELDFSAYRERQRAATGPPTDPAGVPRGDRQPRSSADSSSPTASDVPEVRHMVTDTTMEALAPILASNPRGVLCARDELRGWFGSFDQYRRSGGGTDESNWLTLWNAADLRVDRKSGQPRTVMVPDALVSVCGTIQPEILQRMLTADRVASGLAARLLLASPPWQLSDDLDETELDETAAANYGRLVEWLYRSLNHAGEINDRRQPHLVMLTTEARELWRQSRRAHRRELDDLDSVLRGVWEKLREYAARLALVVHFCRWAETGSTVDRLTLDAASLQAGITLARWFAHEARRLHAVRSGETSPLESRLVEWLHGRGLVAIRDVQRTGPNVVRKLSRDDLRAVVDRLTSAGVVRWSGEPHGRGSRFELMPTVTVSHAERQPLNDRPATHQPVSPEPSRQPVAPARETVEL